METQKKIKIIRKGDVTKVAHEFICSPQTVANAMSGRSTSLFCKAIREWVKNPNNNILYVEY
jgi:ABC-type uncharacterized transport system ATPase subunit